VASGADVVSVAKNPLLVLVFVAALPSLVVTTPVGMILPCVVVPDGLDVSVTTATDDSPVVGATVATVVGITVSEVTGKPCDVLLSVAVVGTTTGSPDDVTDVNCCAGGLVVVGTSVLETVGASVKVVGVSTTDDTVGVGETEADCTVVAVSVSVAGMTAG
jgi:hypothetical protein